MNKCSRCGQCCSSVLPWKEQEYQIVKEYLKDKPEIIEYAKKQSDIIPEEDNLINLQCPFYNRQKKICLIYEVRPSICKTFICSMKRKEIIDNRNMHELNAYYNYRKGKEINRIKTTWELFDLPLVNHNIDIFIKLDIVNKFKEKNGLLTEESLKKALDYLNNLGINILNKYLEKSLQIYLNNKDLKIEIQEEEND